MVLPGCIVFGLLAGSLQTNGIHTRLDVRLADSIHAAALQSSPFLRGIMIFGFYPGEHIVVAIAWAGEWATWLVLSAHIHRARPVFAVPVWHRTRHRVS